jgi:Phage DNA packaging protein Nu1
MEHALLFQSSPATGRDGAPNDRNPPAASADAINMGVRANKAELTAILGCAPSTLTAWIERYGDEFPVVERGTNGREWQFDPADVIAFLKTRRAEEERQAAEHVALLQQFALPGLTSPDDAAGVVKPADLLALARVRQIHRREHLESGLLVRTDDVRTALAGHLTRLDRWAADVLARIAGKHGWPLAVLDEAHAMFREGRLAFVRDLGPYAPDGAEQSGDLLGVARRVAPVDGVAA